jgi:ABC-2 type transport system ATP-binding protein
LLALVCERSGLWVGDALLFAVLLESSRCICNPLEFNYRAHALYERRSMTHGKPAIFAEDLVKSYGKTRALAGLNLEVEEGTVLGLLGPNGAGKTTAVRILTTLLKPDAGRAEVFGFDVVGQADELRSRMGLTGQYAAVDEYLTGRENLEMFGRLYHLPKKEARRRADELLERFDLVDAASRLVKTYSGGMRRRLDLAASLVIFPPVLFLDEPTTGLDPRSRLGMWDIIGELVAGGTTLLLTTQYLDEADRLADRIAVVDSGTVIAEGTADELKARVGGERLEVTVTQGADLAAAVRVLEHYAKGGADSLDGSVRVDADRRLASATVEGGAGLLATVVRELDDAGVQLDDLGLHRPTLDDVFLALTGHTAEPGDENSEGNADDRGEKEVA